jgi:LemA protein
MIIFLLLIIALLLSGVFMYNSLIVKKNDVQKSFGSIDVLLKKRYDMIPNLVETVKEYMGYEKQVLTDVTALRSKAMTGNISNEERVQVENELSRGLGKIKVAVENYPDLKANQNFIQLLSTWTALEEQISGARAGYNSSVTSYNNAVEMFPSNIIAGLMGYTTKNIFEVSEPERQNIDAKQLFRS